MIDITPIDDPDEEGNETLVLTLQSGLGYEIRTPNIGTITIVDNDGPFDTTDAGPATITAQGENGADESKAKAFDNDVNTKWLDFANANPYTRASRIQYQYAAGNRYIVSSYTLDSANDAPERDPRDWTLSGSNDGVTFVPLDTRSNEVFSERFQTRSFNVVNGTGYNIYRLDVHSVADSTLANSVQLAEIALIGVLEPSSCRGGSHQPDDRAGRQWRRDGYCDGCPDDHQSDRRRSVERGRTNRAAHRSPPILTPM